MEKNKFNIRKLIVSILLLMTYIIISGSGNLSTSHASVNSGSINFELIAENNRLKNALEIMTQRFDGIESQLNEMKEYNKELYSEFMGVTYDTTDFHLYRNDSAMLMFTTYDSMFNTLDENSIYVAERLALELEKLKNTSELFLQNKYAINYYPTISPIRTKDFIKLTSPYGYRKDPFTGKKIFHEGVDISANVGAPIYASASGTVVKILYSKYGYGNRIIIKHKYGFETLYAHVNKIKVKKGQWVYKNQQIGSVGNTGRSTGPHLHYEIRKYDETRDPLGYFYTYLTSDLLAEK